VLGDQAYCLALDSVPDSENQSSEARYSIIAIDPLEIVHASSLSMCKPESVINDVHWPFMGGWIGSLSYEAYQDFLPEVKPRQTRYPISSFAFYDSFFIFDQATKQAYVASLGLDDLVSASDEGLAQQKIKVLKALLEAPKNTAAPGTASGAPTEKITASVTKEEYRQNIARIHEYIQAGDTYQINYSMEFNAKTQQSALALYQSLRDLSPAPYAAYLNYGTYQILSASPESFLEIDGSKVRTCPIKGTRARHQDPREDQRLLEELKTSAKDNAELLMITDLERNDLGRVCEPGSVKTQSLLTVQSLPQVHHLFSIVEGQLRAGETPGSVLSVCFPGGSITGAPKLRAMQIIHELEIHSREIYTGVIGYVSVDGKAHFNIAIRTLIYDAGNVLFWGGGGIVHDSDADAEYEEAWVKTKGIREALGSPLRIK
jgi:para-aminobenzoate synthetase component 1